LQNAEGGINGRQIQLVVRDDQSTTTQDQTAAQNLIGDNVFGVIDYSSFTFAGARALQQAGVPVTGYAFDGPEWGQQPYTNMFSYLPPFETPFAGQYYNWDFYGRFLQQAGVTKLAGLAYGNSPSAIEGLEGELAAAKSLGISTCYKNESVPFGAVDFTAEALAIKKAGCNGVTALFVDASDIALSQTLKNAGVTAKQLYAGTGYDQSLLTNPSAVQSFSGSYITSQINFTTPNAATQAMLSALKKYDSHYTGGIPDFGLYGSYLAADLMIKGLEMAGQNPTRQTFINNLRQVTSYDAGGILSTQTTFANFGTKAMLPQQSCQYIIQLEQSPAQYVVSNGGKPVCGQLIPVPKS